MIEQRNIALCVILTIATFGIYGLYWFVCLTNETNEASSRVGDISGIGALILSLVTCNIYELYWAYRQVEKLEQAKADYDIPTDSRRSLIYLLLCLFGLWIVAYALMQDELNKIAYYT